MAPPVNNLIAALARHPELDRQAVLAVARQEGLGGGIGDGGHAFGPFQVNDAGGVITGRFRGQSPEQINQWAWSPQGIEYALSGISRAAGGQHGGQAVKSIVSRFERPADPAGEISRALASYGGGGGGGAAPAGGMGMPGRGSSVDPRLLQILLATRQAVGLPAPSAQLQQALQQRIPARAQTFQAQPGVAPAGSHGGGIAELLREGTGGPTHSTGPHVHAAFTNPQLELAAIRYAQGLGLHVGENPYVGSLSPGVHAPHSFHNQTFPGLYNGRQLGEAIDVSGGNTNPFYAWLAQHRGGRA